MVGIWELEYWEGSDHSLVSGLLCLNCANDTVYVTHRLSFWKFGIWAHGRQRCICDQPPIKTLDPESLKNFPGRRSFTHVVALIAGGIKHVLGNSTGS